MKKNNVILKGTLCGRELSSPSYLRLTETLVVHLESATIRRGKSVKKKIFTHTRIIEVFIFDTNCLSEEVRKNLFKRGAEIKLKVTGDRKNQKLEIISISERKYNKLKDVCRF